MSIVGSCIRIKEVNAVSRGAMLKAINSTTRNWPAAHPKPSNKRVCHETSNDKPDNDVNKLVDEVVCGSDRKFFQQHLHRRFRIRPAWDVEMEQIDKHSMRPIRQHAVFAGG